MACTSMNVSGTTPAAAREAIGSHCRSCGLRRSDSASELRCGGAGIRRSRSEPKLRCSLNVAARAVAEPTKLKSSKSIGIFPFHLSGSILSNSPLSFPLDSEESGKGVGIVDPEEIDEESAGGGADEAEVEIGKEKRANWVERLLELRSRWRNRQHENEGEAEEDEDEEEMHYYCGVSYDSDAEDSAAVEEEEEEESKWDRESFSTLLAPAAWSETKLFSQLAFLCNMAYVISDIKADDLRTSYGLRWVTSSLEKKAAAAAMKARLENGSNQPMTHNSEPDSGAGSRRPIRSPSVAYEIAASAASYVHSRAKCLLALGGGLEDGVATKPAEVRGAEGGRMYNSEVAAYVAATTMTAVVAAEEEARLEAAKELQCLHSSPCEWFVCDDPGTFTRCFVVQGSDSMASWQANLFFEPTKFEETEVLVHRGIYEAAKGIYEQFMPEILAHLSRHGDRARLRFTGHSLGGSLSLLVNLMLLSRGAVPRSAVLPVVTFGSPSVFCGGHRVIQELGLDEGHVCSVIMHRDIVPRAFSCNYPTRVAQVLKRLNGAFHSHPCLNKEKLLYSPMGQLYILQPEEKSSPPHPLLPPGAALYALDGSGNMGSTVVSKAGMASAIRAFINSPHPLETLSNLTAYGSEGTILRDHESCNYLKAINGLLRQHTQSFSRRSRKQQKLQHWWPSLVPAAPSRLPSNSWVGKGSGGLEKPAALVTNEVATGV